MRILLVALLVGCGIHPDPAGKEGRAPAPDASTAETSPGEAFTVESFQAPDAQRADILFVVDNSRGPMTDHQARLASAMPTLVDALDAAGLDWHAGVTSTDVNANYGDPLEGRLVTQSGERWASPALTEPALWLEGAVQIGGLGYGEEKGLAAAYIALDLRRDGDNAGFVRDDAGLHVVVLSDEDDQSNELRPELITVDEFVTWMGTEQGPNRSVSLSSLVCVTNEACHPDQVGHRYLEVTEALGGVVSDIHDDMDLAVDAIAAHVIAQSGFRTLELADVPPDPAAIEVVIDGVVLDPAEWTYDAVTNSVELTDPAPDASDIVVRWPEA